MVHKNEMLFFKASCTLQFKNRSAVRHKTGTIQSRVDIRYAGAVK